MFLAEERLFRVTNMKSRIKCCLLFASLAGLVFGSIATAITYERDLNNQLTRVTYPSGDQIIYTYDEAGNITGLEVVVISENGSGAVQPFADLEDWGGGWRNSDWLGFFNDGGSPWLFHLEHGWIFFVYRTEEDDFFLFDLSSGQWWYTSESVYPSLYMFTREAWVFYFQGTSNPRSFVDLLTGEFFEVL